MVIVLNAVDRLWKRRSFVFVHRYYDPCLVYCDDLDDGLEDYASYLSTYAPGLLMAIGGEEHQRLIDEYLEDNDLVLDGLSDDEKYTAFDAAEADLTHTESGYLTSEEWNIALENPSRKTLKQYIEDHGGSRAPRLLRAGWRVENEGRVCELRHLNYSWCYEHLRPTLERVYTKITCFACLAEKGAP